MGRLRSFECTGGANPSKRAVESRQTAWSNRKSELLVHASAPLKESLSVYLAKFWGFARLGPGNVLASVLTAARWEWHLLPRLPLVFVCYHVSYGLGFLRGMWDFIICRRRPGASYERLTRPTAKQSPS